MIEVRLRVGVFDIEFERFSIGHFRLGNFPGFRESMPALNPNCGLVRFQVERVPVVPDGQLPLPGVAGTIG